ncbi:MAG: Gfo/Idh/MocA family oxidoreductase [Akkermansiaceae bacterium]|nr:Gfo/Idh/MocA family oxidoreductase [Akkermansiaceae bacterium]
MKQITRRSFLATTAMAAGSAVAAPVSPNEKLRLGIIGSGGRGGANTNGVKGEEIAWLCDTNRKVLDGLKTKFSGAKQTTDWREVIADDSIDAVVISTADHHHALAAVAAMKSGKHVYCEKPLAHNPREARIMRDTCKGAQGKVATQMGTQIHATDNYRRVVELVQSGAIGKVREAHVWCSRSINPIGEAVLPKQDVPEWFDWDVWLGPAADRDYNEGYWKGGNLNWNRRWDFGNGVLGDMGSHLIDLPWWALNLQEPLSVEAEGPTADPVACPPWLKVTWEHAPRSGPAALDAGVKVIWYHGGKEHRPSIDTGMDLGKWFNGILFVGDDGMLLADYGKRFLLPEKKFRNFEPPGPTIAKSPGHYNEWLAACRGEGSTLCNFEYSGSLIEHNLLGTTAYRAGKKLQWEPGTMKIPNVPEAEKFLGRTYRKGWEI